MATWLRPLLLIAAFVGQQALETSSRADGTIAGQVVDAVTGKPIGAVVVTLSGRGRPQEEAPGSVLTTNDGRFVFAGLRAGDYGLAAQRPGYHGGLVDQRRPSGPGHSVTLRDGDRQDTILRLWKYGVISGTVVDEAGDPVIGIQVRAWATRDPHGRQSLTPQGFGYTDDRGYYRLHNLPPGEYIVGAGNRQVAVPQSWSERAFPAVRQPPGKPGSATAIAVGEQVVEVGRGGAIPPPPRGQRLFIYPPMFYSAAHNERAAAPVTVESGAERTGTDLQLLPAPTARVTGRLTSPQGVASGISVRLSPAGLSSPTIDFGESLTVSEQTGRFGFPAVAAGAYMLRAATEARVPTNPEEPIERGWWAELPINVDGDVEDVVLTLEAGLRISGRLEFDGTRPAPTDDRLRRIRPAIYSAQSDAPLRLPAATTRTEQSGTFASIGLARGRYYVRLGQPPEGWVLRSVTLNGRDVSVTPLELARDDATGVVLQFTDRPGAITGTVRSSEAPDSTAAVVLFPSDSARWVDTAPDAPGFRIVRAGRAGDYAIDNLPAGSYYVAAIPDELAGICLDHDFLERLSTSATLVAISEGERHAVDLRAALIK